MTLTPSLLIGISLSFPLLVLLLIGLLGRSANLRDGVTLALSSVLFYFVCCHRQPLPVGMPWGQYEDRPH